MSISLSPSLGGSIETAEITAANVTDAKLASPNNSAYKALFQGVAKFPPAATNATYIMSPTVTTQAAVVSGTTSTQAANVNAPVPYVFANADYTVAGLTQKLMIRAVIETNATSVGTVTFTVGLYPVTSAGGVTAQVLTLGSVVSGSTVAFVNPGTSATTTGQATDFTIPADGTYLLGVVTSAPTAASSVATVAAQVMSRNV